MQFDLIPLQEFIKNNAKTPTKDTIEDFKIKINNFLSQALKANEEDYQKKEISNFLEKTYDYITNIRGSIDLTIYVDDIVNVIFEVKSTINKKEFPQSNQDLSSKAFYESVLYFLRERKSKKNNFIKFIIICTVKDFFIIDAREYERLFENDKTIIKHYKNCDEKQGTNTKTQEFYDQLSSYLKTLDKNLKYTHFELRDDLDETTLSYIYQILSPQVLLKEKITQDANALNENFYKELLYILGLKEEGEKSKKIILSDTPNTLSYAIKQAYKDISFDDIFALLITWNNRILFLRLFESMLLSFNHIQKPFLTIEKIPNFAKLSELFFEVLAKKEEQRGVKEFDFIPYLNSSLFDKNTQEQQHKDIRLLDSKPLEIFQNSKLAQEYKDLKSLPLLEYLFAFLRTYDFTTTSKDIQNNQKINHDKLINASVLGNVFEKLNGYKEGSYYTPSFITSYMCKESIQKIVFDKFEQEHSLKANSIDDLRVLIDRNFTLEKQKAYFNTILSIKICDPAVGSGHFLVSALNELVYILYQLGLIKSLLREKLILENDELIIYTNDKGIFNYQKPNFQNDPFHQIQKELFECKKLIIENCLFGVDINPNSCEITKLRLWIELLKYSFYIFENDKNTNTLQILPNIDINIKCGNSLISKIPTNEPLMLQTQESVKLYKQLEDDYYNGLYINKEEHLEKINKIKSNFIKAYINVKHAKEIKDFHKKCEEYAKNYEDFGLNTLPEKYEELKMRIQCQLINLSLFNVADIDKEKALKDLEVLKEKYDEIFYGFEWRMEFSKILHSSLSKEEITNNNLSKQKGNFKNLHKDKEGDFLGFDLVIGNPPYIKENDNKEIFANTKNLRTYQGKMDIWYHFVGRGFDILKDNGILSFIATNNWITNSGAQKLRNVVLEESKILNIVDFNSFKVFSSADIQTMIMEFKKTKPPKNYNFHYAKITTKEPNFKDAIAILNNENSQNNEIFDINFAPKNFIGKTLNFAKNDYDGLFEKIQKCGKFYLDEKEVAQGIVPNPDVVTKKNINNEMISKGIKIGDGVFVIEKNSLNVPKNEQKYLKPLYEVENFEKYHFNKKNSKQLIYTTKNNCKKENIPTIINHLHKFRTIMDNRRENLNKKLDFYHLHWARDKSFFESGEKIISVRKCAEPIFSYLNSEAYVMLSLNVIKTQRINTKYLTAILNSKLIAFWLKYKGKMQGNNYQIDKEPLLNIPIVDINSKNEKLANELISLVDEILKAKVQDKNANTSPLEEKINSIVYKLYNLSEEEIKIIEGK
ncbi:type IIS restriction/modification enzyme [Campylobacter peloridis]|uniref:site-specific DNA-methyltransferase (adenine-specific) n=1 Tax=Campylobacter peloridis TaxID=488546 RepID=A0ABX6TR61_9BACT|nr:type IIS restriction/modification enzyme [Campylobacter peloridis]AJC84367.1 type II restriction endonuclease [Campylobacter peloridis LMG 23910]QOQ88463.1 type IIS restriction/modification enzyme [Campylobacter peloridis]